MLRKVLFTGVFVAGLAACSAVDRYESQVSGLEPVYCYQSLAAVQCYREPKHSDSLRLVNYFGPHPSRYDAPEAKPVPDLKAPEMVNYWVKDGEPVPRPLPHGDLADRPWLTEEGRNDQRASAEMTALQASEVGTNALLRRISYSEPETLNLPSPDTEVK